VNISRAAVLLDVERTNLHKKMRAFGIRRGNE
jgi:transcriptional regulator of acetoin/glycerol metabolism